MSETNGIDPFAQVSICFDIAEQLVTAIKTSALLLAALVLFVPLTPAQDEIPVGTILPGALSETVSASSKPGQTISIRLMQDVPLPGGRKMQKGTSVRGRLISVAQSKGGTGEDLSIVFDTLVSRNRILPVTTSLRAMASFTDVEAASIPTSGPDRATPETDWTTELIGGDIDYRGGGPVEEGAELVGRPVSDGVLIRVSANPVGQCRGPIDGNKDPQALWVFSSNSCGLYGLPGVTLVHAGRDNPIGEIVLHADNRKWKLRGGAGILLRVIGSGKEPARPHN